LESCTGWGLNVAIYQYHLIDLISTWHTCFLCLTSAPCNTRREYTYSNFAFTLILLYVRWTSIPPCSPLGRCVHIVRYWWRVYFCHALVPSLVSGKCDVADYVVCCLSMKSCVGVLVVLRCKVRVNRSMML
jgi:hypothetical protein